MRTRKEEEIRQRILFLDVQDENRYLASNGGALPAVYGQGNSSPNYPIQQHAFASVGNFQNSLSMTSISPVPTSNSLEDRVDSSISGSMRPVGISPPMVASDRSHSPPLDYELVNPDSVVCSFSFSPPSPRLTSFGGTFFADSCFHLFIS